MDHIKEYQGFVRDLIQWDIEQNRNFESVFPGTLSMRDAVRFALNSGKRLRPMIVLSIGQRSQAAGYFALFIEYVHNSSLVVDDLPCMDNDIDRRGQPTVHYKYGEYTAQLLAYNLMVTAMKHFSDGMREVQTIMQANRTSTREQFDQLYDQLNSEVSESLGYRGICGGQFLDLLVCTDDHLTTRPPREQQELLLKIIRLKTGCLFGLSMSLGWISNGGNVDYLTEIKDAGYALGMCYQIVDDLRDIEKDQEKNGANNNIAKYFTHNEIIDLFTDNMEYFSMVMSKYQCWNPVMEELYSYMIQSFKKELSKVRSN